MPTPRKLHVKRVYDPPSPEDGQRVLVDRLWPRGLSKEKAQIDLWAKEIAPSTELRKWFAHEVDKWPEFQRRYREELAANAEAVDQLHTELSSETVTLLFATRETEFNHAHVLAEILSEQ